VTGEGGSERHRRAKDGICFLKGCGDVEGGEQVLLTGEGGGCCTGKKHAGKGGRQPASLHQKKEKCEPYRSVRNHSKKRTGELVRMLKGKGYGEGEWRKTKQGKIKRAFPHVKGGPEIRSGRHAEEGEHKTNRQC